jgi:hypothetical protein
MEEQTVREDEGMTAADLETYVETELERIHRWRSEELERAGYDAKQAAKVAVRLDVDLHHAIDLVQGGCPPHLALEILL